MDSVVRGQVASYILPSIKKEWEVETKFWGAVVGTSASHPVPFRFRVRFSARLFSLR